MRITRILFDEAEPAESIAQRIVRAFSPGEILCVRGKFFKVSNMRTVSLMIRDAIVEDKYTLILNIGEPAPVIVAPPPPVVSEPQVEEPVIEKVLAQPIPKKTPESGKYKIVRADAAKVTREGPPKSLPIAGEVWQTKDTRRANSPSFTVLSVDTEFVHTDKGGKISLKRWQKYRRVDPSVGVLQRSSG
jgi:hypothetical protein